MAQIFHATPMLKGEEAVKLLKQILTCKPDKEKIERLENGFKRIRNYKRCCNN